MARCGADRGPWLRDDDGEAPGSSGGARDDGGAGPGLREAEPSPPQAERIELDRADGERQAGAGGLRGEDEGGGAAQDAGAGGADGGARDSGHGPAGGIAERVAERGEHIAPGRGQDDLRQGQVGGAAVRRVGVGEVGDAEVAQGEGDAGGAGRRARVGAAPERGGARVEGDEDGLHGRAAALADIQAKPEGGGAGGGGERGEDGVEAPDGRGMPGDPRGEGDGEGPPRRGGDVARGEAVAPPDRDGDTAAVGEDGESGHRIGRRADGDGHVVLDVGGGAVDEDAIDGDGRVGLVGSRRAGEARVEQGLLVGDVGIEGDGGGGGTDEEGERGRGGDEEEREGGGAQGRAPAGAGTGHHRLTIHRAPLCGNAEHVPSHPVGNRAGSRRRGRATYARDVILGLLCNPRYPYEMGGPGGQRVLRVASSSGTMNRVKPFGPSSPCYVRSDP